MNFYTIFFGRAFSNNNTVIPAFAGMTTEWYNRWDDEKMFYIFSFQCIIIPASGSENLQLLTMLLSMAGVWLMPPATVAGSGPCHSV